MVRTRTNPRGIQVVGQGSDGVEAKLDQILAIIHETNARLGNLEQEMREKDRVEQEVLINEEVLNNEDEGENSHYHI